MRRAALPLLLLGACTPETASVELALSGPIPEEVTSISVNVRDEELQVVTSATVAAPKSVLVLGVPAERPLEFRVIARTRRPGPAAIGRMPAYFGAVARTVPLGREQELVAVNLRRAGVLSVGVEFRRGARSAVELLFEPEDRRAAAQRLRVEPRREGERSLVLERGRYRVSIQGEDPGERSVDGGRELYVAPEVESVARLVVRTASASPEPGEPQRLALELIDQAGAPATELLGPGTLTLSARDGTGREVSILEARVRISALASAGVEPQLAAEQEGGLPMRLPLAAQGVGRLRLLVTAVLGEERVLEAELALNVRPPALRPGPLASLGLELGHPDRLAGGAPLFLELLDARGLYTAARAQVDLSRSDPWISFPEGARVALEPPAGGWARRTLLRPSAPRGLPTFVHATLTSSAGLSRTATLALPPP